MDVNDPDSYINHIFGPGAKARLSSKSFPHNNRKKRITKCNQKKKTTALLTKECVSLEEKLGDRKEVIILDPEFLNLRIMVMDNLAKLVKDKEITRLLKQQKQLIFAGTKGIKIDVENKIGYGTKRTDSAGSRNNLSPNQSKSISSLRSKGASKKGSSPLECDSVSVTSSKSLRKPGSNVAIKKSKSMSKQNLKKVHSLRKVKSRKRVAKTIPKIIKDAGRENLLSKLAMISRMLAELNSGNFRKSLKDLSGKENIGDQHSEADKWLLNKLMG